MGVDMKVKAIYDSEIGNITRSEKNWMDPVPRLLAFWTAMMRSALLDWRKRLPPALLFLYVSLISSHLLS